MPIKIFLPLILFASTALSAMHPQSAVDTYRLLNKFSEAFKCARREYVTPVSDEQLIEGAIAGMIKTLDPYSEYIPPDQYASMQTQLDGNFEGIGLELSKDGEQVRVISPLEGSPAWKAGIQSGDLILSINGRTVNNLSTAAISKRLSGRKGERLTLEINRPSSNKSFTLTLERKALVIDNVRWEVKESIAYIRLSSFHTQNTGKRLQTALKEILKQHPHVEGIILDLRDNPGGILEEAIKCASLFLKEGPIVHIETKNNKKSSFNSSMDPLCTQKPLVVLVNEGTASCAEILAGALQDHKRAILLGVKTFGKGTIQTIFPIPPGYSAIRITTGQYLTPNGQNIHETGIHPNILIEPLKNKSQDIQRVQARAILKNQYPLVQPS